MSMMLPSTCGGIQKRLVASQKSHPVMIQMVETDTSVPIISALCQPKVKFLFADFWAMVRARMEMPKPTKSLAKCAESVKIAIDPAI